MARHPRWARRFMSEADFDAVTRAIAEAESSTSAEIRIHLDHACPGDAVASAVRVFERLGMHRTAERHGVLIYAAVKHRKLAVIGDEGIHERVGEAYWQRLVDGMLSHFRSERARDGFIHALGELTAVLRQHFPRRPDDRNELSDEISVE
jgi:uncharacterized membrane protein